MEAILLATHASSIQRITDGQLPYTIMCAHGPHSGLEDGSRSLSWKLETKGKSNQTIFFHKQVWGKSLMHCNLVEPCDGRLRSDLRWNVVTQRMHPKNACKSDQSVVVSSARSWSRSGVGRVSNNQVVCLSLTKNMLFSLPHWACRFYSFPAISGDEMQ